MRCRHARRFALLLMAGLAGSLVVIAWRDATQARLNQALIAAVRHADAQVVVALLMQGADANARDDKANRLSLWTRLLSRFTRQTSAHSPAPSALAIACGYSGDDEAYLSPKQLDVVAALIAKGADVNGKTPDGNAVIIFPIRCENAQCVRMLLNAGADPNAADVKGTPALLAAAGGYDPRTSKRTLPNGQVVVEVAIGHRVLDASQWKAEYVIIEALLNKGARVESKCYGGGTALFWVCKDDYVEAERLLVAHGADVNARDDYGDTPLMEAGSYGCQGTVRFLLAHGADIKARNNDGKTGLLETAEYRYSEVIQTLLAHGADPTVKDYKGRGALKIVRQGFDDGRVYRLLKHAGAKE